MIFLVKHFTPEIVFDSRIERPIDCRALIVDNAFAGILCDSPEGACFISALDFYELQKSLWTCNTYRFTFPCLVSAALAATHGNEELSRIIVERWGN